jgi:glucokinase
MVIDINGPRCQGNCPGRGCLETLASGTALGREGRLAAERQPDSALGRLLAEGRAIDGKTVTEAAQDGDPTASAVVEAIGRNLGVALSGLANTFEPEAIVIGGGVIGAGELLLEPARRELRARALRPANQTPVLRAELGPDAGMIGAAAMARIEAEREGG